MDSVDMTDLSPAQLPMLIKEWMATEDELRALSAEIREKRKRTKLVRDMITKIMKGNKLGQLNIKKGSVTVRTTKTKAPMTKKYLMSALTDFFEGNTELAAKCAAFLDEHRPIKNNDKLELDAIASPK